MSTTSHFYQTIRSLLEDGTLTLYGRVKPFRKEEEKGVIVLLEEKYEEDRLNYPYEAPQFNAKSALWGAKILYLSAQLLLYRDLVADDAAALLPADFKEKDGSAILSADLCLRFMPQILDQYETIAEDDPLLPKLRDIMSGWPYSALGYAKDVKLEEWQQILSHPCLHQLTIDRIIGRKAINYAMSDVFLHDVAGALGGYGTFFWKEFTEKSALKVTETPE